MESIFKLEQFNKYHTLTDSATGAPWNNFKWFGYLFFFIFDTNSSFLSPNPPMYPPCPLSNSQPFFINCCYMHMCICKYITSLICMLLECMFSGLTICYWITSSPSCVLFSWEDYFFPSQHFFVACPSLWRVEALWVSIQSLSSCLVLLSVSHLHSPVPFPAPCHPS